MNISLNGTLPTTEMIQAILTAFTNKEITVTEFYIDTDSLTPYEGNMEWEYMRIVFSNGDVVLTSGYHAMFEVLAFDKLSDSWKYDTMVDHLQWMLDKMQDDPELYELED
jgi:hypothetical protein